MEVIGTGQIKECKLQFSLIKVQSTLINSDASIILN